MDDSVRTIRWANNILKFSCGIKVNMTEPQLEKLFKMFKLEEEFKVMVEKGQITIPKGRAFQMRSYLT